MKFAFVAVSLLLSTPVFAATDSFVVGGTTITFPVPAGYCRPEGKAVDAFRILAKADTMNVTHLDLVPCASRTVVAFDHIAIKTPVTIVGQTIARADLLAQMKPEFDKPEFKANVASNVGKLTDNLNAQTGTKLDIAGDFRPRGMDKECAYIGGTLLVSNASGPKVPPQGAAACLSSVAGKFVSLNFYSADPSNASVQKLMGRARAMLLSMSGRAAK